MGGENVTTFADLAKLVDGFVSKYGVVGADRDKLKADLLELVQKGIEHGEGKDQTKISGIIVNGIKAFMGRGN